ncbi:MAG: FecR domain-containing protein, partial [Myxococcota bacterium]
MSDVTLPHNACAARELALEALLGHDAARAHAAQHAYEQHRATCAVCLADERWLELLRADGPLGPSEPLDEVARMRLVHRVLDAHDAAPRRGRSMGLWFAVPAACALAALVAASWLIWRPAPAGIAADAVSALTPPSTIYERAPHSVLVAGVVTVQGVPAHLADTVGTDGTLETARGSIVMALGDGVLAHLGGEGRLRLTRHNEQGMVLRLEAGRLLVTAPEGRHHRRLEIETPAGVVAVVGTVVAVDAQQGAVEVQVLRGQAEVSEPGRPRRPVPVGGVLRLGSARVRTSVATAQRDLWQLAHGLEALSDHDDAAVLRVRSVPQRAVVLVDGRELGETPLAARVGPGRHVVRVSDATRSEVREVLLSSAHETVSTFDLRGLAKVLRASEQVAAP